MSSFLRNLQRRPDRKRTDYTPAPQPTIVQKDGYYTLRATRGWIWMSTKRLAAQMNMARILERVATPRPKKAAKVWRKPTPVPAGTVTRQQRRAALR